MKAKKTNVHMTAKHPPTKYAIKETVSLSFTNSGSAAGMSGYLKSAYIGLKMTEPGSASAFTAKETV